MTIKEFKEGLLAVKLDFGIEVTDGNGGAIMTVNADVLFDDHFDVIKAFCVSNDAFYNVNADESSEKITVSIRPRFPYDAKG